MPFDVSMQLCNEVLTFPSKEDKARSWTQFFLPEVTYSLSGSSSDTPAYPPEVISPYDLSQRGNNDSWFAQSNKLVDSN